MTRRYIGQCARCGAELDPHESVVVTVRDKRAGRTSLAALGELSGEGVALFHENCSSPPALSADAGSAKAVSPP